MQKMRERDIVKFLRFLAMHNYCMRCASALDRLFTCIISSVPYRQAIRIILARGDIFYLIILDNSNLISRFISIVTEKL